MSKPDWAERLQRTFKRKYEEGFNAGVTQGWNDGFFTGSKKAIAESRKVFIKRIQKELETAPKSEHAGLHKAIELIRKGK